MISIQSAQFLDHLENFWIVWKIFGESERFPYRLENVTHSLEDFRTV